MRQWALLVGILALAGCGEDVSPEEQAAQDERDRQMVEEVNRGALLPIAPEPILYPDIEEYELYGTSCAFVPQGGGLGAVVLAMMEDGYMKLEGEMVRFAADSGSAELPYGTWAKYVGKEYAFELQLAEDEGRQVAAESMNYPGRLTVHDAAEHMVYDMPGEVQCGS